MMKRVLFGGMLQESNSFVPGRTTLDRFRDSGLEEGDDVLTKSRGLGDSLDGMIEVASAAGVTLIPTIHAQSNSGPPVTDDAHHYIKERILAGARQHRGALDGVILSLHGAMLTESLEDPEGDLLELVREIVGPDVPIVASFDLHTHMTARMAKYADGIVVYHTSPHIDIRETGVRAMQLLVKAMNGARPVVAFRKFRMMASSEPHDTNHPPMRDIMRRLLEIEQEPGILAAAICATQPWFDVSELGWSIVVVADGDRALAQARADEVAKMTWQRREEFRVQKTPIEDAVRTVLASTTRPFVLSDCADSPSAGGLGDGNLLLKALLAMNYQDTAIMTMTDPDAVARCHAAGVGAELTLDLGGKLNPQFFSPVTVTGRVRTLTDGRYLSKYPPAWIDVGLRAVLEIGGISVVISERPAPMLDLQAFLSAGLDPQEAKIVQPKSAGGYRAYYEPIAVKCIDIDTVGPSGSDLPKLPFKKIPRPLWPWDADLQEPW